LRSVPKLQKARVPLLAGNLGIPRKTWPAVPPGRATKPRTAGSRLANGYSYGRAAELCCGAVRGANPYRRAPIWLRRRLFAGGLICTGWHRHHLSHKPARAAQRVLLETSQWPTLDHQRSRERCGQHLVRADGALMGGRQVQVLRRKPEDVRPRRRTRNPRLRLHPQRRHQGSSSRVIWRWHAV
jgi:hypothetical protein